MTRFRGTLTPPIPSALLREIGLAHQRALDLAERDRQLQFILDACGRVAVELRTNDGRLVSEISVALALEIVNAVDLDAALGAATPPKDDLRRSPPGGAPDA